MGRRGPLPKPTALRVLQGNPSKRPLPVNEPKPPSGPPKCPSWLDPVAKREFRRALKILQQVPGLVTEVDGTALAAYAQAYSMWRKATEVLEREGLTFTTENGYVVQRPEVSIAQKAMQLIRAFCAEFGMTPSARGRMQVPQTKTGEDDYEEFRRRGQARSG